MTHSGNTPSFEPVLLDLAEKDDYLVVIQALEEYEGAMLHEADGERWRIQSNNLPQSESDEERYEALANRAAKIRLNIDDQLEANAAARRTDPSD